MYLILCVPNNSARAKDPRPHRSAIRSLPRELQERNPDLPLSGGVPSLPPIFQNPTPLPVCGVSPA